jgi:C1A family cysteine protease
MKTYEKSYGHDEFYYRYRIFKNNMDQIEEINNKQSEYTAAINKFADLTAEEFAGLYGGVKPKTVSGTAVASSGSAVPTAWDWRVKGAVTPIKNQEQCGSCWAFSTTGSTEGCHQISTGNLVSLSEQNLMDCSYAEGDEGCGGGLMTNAMNYIISNGGIDTEASYPYTASNGASCLYTAANSGATLKSYVNVVSGSESDLQQSKSSQIVCYSVDNDLQYALLFL